MASEPHLWMKRIKAVEREFQASQFSLVRVASATKQDPTILVNDLQVRDIDKATEHLEGTYIIRVFAEFETGLRKFWNRNRAKEQKKQTPAEVLVDNVAAQARVPTDTLTQVHKVRILRNLLAHETEKKIDDVSMSEVRSCLCQYLHNLYHIWG